MMAETRSMAERLAELRSTYGRNLKDRIGEVQAVLDGATPDNGGAMTPESLSRLRDLTHKLAGSGATFGFAEVSEIARDIERHAIAALDNPAGQSQGMIEGFARDCARLMDAAEVSPSPDSQQALTVDPAPAPAADDDAKRKRVLVLEPDTQERQRLCAELDQFGYQVEATSRSDDLEGSLIKTRPDVLLTDLVFNNDVKGGLDLLSKLKQDGKLKLPVIIYTAVDDIKHRLRAVRAGAYHYLVKPVEISDIVDTLDRACTEWEHEPLRILIIDDDESVARYTELVLQGAGMTTRTITDPLTVMDALEDFAPELVLLDLYMPDCNGQEIAAVIRQHKEFDAMPIVFLSGEADKDKQLFAMELGGDDFLTKPIQAAHLISAINIRASRFRELRSMMVRDSMTGLFNHTTTKQFLESELSRAERTRTPLSLAALDIDHFKKVNDTYGHAVGDMVIKALARMLKQRLRGADIVGRMGGEEFAAVLPGASIDVAKTIFDQIRTAFSEMVFRDGDASFSVTISCGIAGFPDIEQVAALSDAADKALYVAKHSGRNRVVCAGTP